MITSDKWVVQLVVDQCKAHGIHKIVFSPGSRNSPFVIAFDEDPDFQTYVIHDERAAAFFALGLISADESPVAICCTSGSAALNYYPAISEAFYQSLPLVVITADRPNAWVNQGDGQTIVQAQVFQQHIRFQVELEDLPHTEELQWKFQRETALAFQRLTGSNRGPVHINVGLREPLYGKIEKTTSYSRVIRKIHALSFEDVAFWEEIAQRLQHRKIMVLCGQLHPNNKLNALLSKFSVHNNVVVLIENTSNLNHERFISCIDRTLNRIPETPEFQPDVLITIGGAVVSKRIKAYLRKCALSAHFRVGTEFTDMDTYQHMTDSFDLPASTFFEQLLPLMPKEVNTNFFGKWKAHDYLAKDAIDLFRDRQNLLNDWTVFYELFQELPENTVLHMANSSVVRYCQLFDSLKGVHYFSNRGTSGIDGSTSTAVGAAIADPKKLHVLVTGDISFLYDSNALWIRPLPSNLRIIVVNNGGGGIFRIIPGPRESEQCARYFEAAHQQDCLPVAQAFGWKGTTVSTTEDLIAILPELLQFESAFQVIEVMTKTAANADTLTNFFSFIKQ